MTLECAEELGELDRVFEAGGVRAARLVVGAVFSNQQGQAVRNPPADQRDSCWGGLRGQAWLPGWQ